MDTTLEKSTALSLPDVIGAAIQIPGVRVNRDSFLCEAFKEVDRDTLQNILEKGPVDSGVARTILRQKAHTLIQTRTALSAGASFAAGLPGGVAMAATIPADMLQFYGVSLRMAQELAYLYGESNLWEKDFLDRDKVTNQLILYCGVMFGATGASQSVRILSSAVAKQALKKLPQQALTKTFYYPVIKSILRFFGITMTKSSFAKGVSKAIPIVGGVVSGGITLATLGPMGLRLAETLDEARFAYSEETFKADWQQVMEVVEQEETTKTAANSAMDSPKMKVQAPAWLNRVKKGHLSKVKMDSSAMDEIRKAKQMLDEGILTEEEFSQAKARILKLLETE